MMALIPAFNEEAHITSTVRRALAHLPAVVIDDGSSDGTADLAREAGAALVRQTPNQGKGAALRAGFRHAIDQGCGAVVVLDADGQHDPDEIPRFLRAFAEGGEDLIIGQRSFEEMPFVRRASNSIGTALFSWAIGQRIPDNQCGYRLVSRRMMQATLESEEQGFEFELDMIVLCVQRGYHLAWVPIRTIYGGESSHIRPWHHLVHFFRVVWQTRQRMRRLPDH